VRFTLHFLPWLALLVALAVVTVRASLLLYFAAAMPLGLLGTWVALERVRRELRARAPEAPPDAALLLGGEGRLRDLGLAWIDGRDLRFATQRGERRIPRADVVRLDDRPWSRELDVWTREPDGRALRFRLGALISLTELPRFARRARAWLIAPPT